MFGIIFLILCVYTLIYSTGRNNMNRSSRERMRRLPQDDPKNITYIDNRGHQRLVSNNHPCMWVQNGRYLKDLKTGNIVFDRYAKGDKIYQRLYKARLLYGYSLDCPYYKRGSDGAPWAYPIWGDDAYINLIHMGTVYNCECGYLNYKRDKIIMPHQCEYFKSIESSYYDVNKKLSESNKSLSELIDRYSYLNENDRKNKIYKYGSFACEHCNDLYLPEHKLYGEAAYVPCLPDLKDIETYNKLFEGGKYIYE